MSFSQTPCSALETWEKIDKRLKPQIYELNLGLKLHFLDGLSAQLSDLSPKGHFPVFSVSRDDKGFKVISVGSAFPVRTSQPEKTFFVTTKHSVENEQIPSIIKEFERFTAATRLYAEQTAVNGNADARYRELLQTINLCTKGKELAGNERQLYETTVDAVWDTYDKYLSMRADPQRVAFQKYLKLLKPDSQVGIFLHAPGPVSQAPLEAHIYKIGKLEGDPDIAIISASGKVAPMDFDPIPPSEGQEIQVIGYPVASDSIDADSNKYFAPTFSTGRISRVGPHLLQVDAPITNGNSGGPVVSTRGKVLGVVAVRAITKSGAELTNFGGAVTIQSVEAFAPDLFSHLPAR